MKIDQGIFSEKCLAQPSLLLGECRQLFSDVKLFFFFLGTTVALIILALGFLLSAQVSPPITLKPVAPLGQNTTCTRYR